MKNWLTQRKIRPPAELWEVVLGALFGLMLIS